MARIISKKGSIGAGGSIRLVLISLVIINTLVPGEVTFGLSGYLRAEL